MYIHKNAKFFKKYSIFLHFPIDICKKEVYNDNHMKHMQN